MKPIASLAFVIAALGLLPACTTVTTDPRSPQNHSSRSSSTDYRSSGDGTTRRVDVEVPQPAPIRVKPGSQPPQYLNTTGGSSSSSYDNSGNAPTSPLRHDTPDQPLYSR